LHWFLAGAAAAAGALVARPEAYRRMRGVLEPSPPQPLLTPPRETGGEPAAPPSPARAAQPPPPPAPAVDPAETDAMRMKIDQTRARIAEKAAHSTDTEAPPAPPPES